MVDIFTSKDEKLERIEKRLAALERKTGQNFSNVSASIDMMKRMMMELQTENKSLKADRDFLLNRYKEILRRVPGSDVISSGIFAPIKDGIKSTSGLVRDIVLEDFEDPKKAGADSLFELVMNRKKISLPDAAREIGVSEKKAKYWALALEKRGLISTDVRMRKTLLMKK
jgi:hypothetical protein